MNSLKLYSNRVIILKYISLKYVKNICVLKLVGSDCLYFDGELQNPLHLKENVFSSPKARNLFKNILKMKSYFPGLFQYTVLGKRNIPKWFDFITVIV